MSANYRYERKFLINNLDQKEMERIVLENPLLFREIYKERVVNNIYFDSFSFDNFMDNVEGNMYRKKFRIRWYGDILNNVNKPILELKIKKGLLGDKKSYSINSFKLFKGFDSNYISNNINSSNLESTLKYEMKSQIPVMLNRYRRKYFESSNKKFRITIDDHQFFYKLNKFNNTFLEKHKDLSSVILEIKYDKKYDSEAAQISNNFPFRLTKSSKYARGIELLYL